MKTLVFCTSYAEAPLVWEQRYRLWIQSLQKASLKIDQLLIVDDGSQVLPDWADLELVDEVDAPSAECVMSDSGILLYRHSQRLGRQSIFQFPGWYRSFAFGVRYGVSHGFQKIIHVESDAHLISRRIHQYLDDFAEGWVAFWCEKYGMPEIAIQVAAGGSVKDMDAFAAEPYEKMAGQNHELMFPFSQVVRIFKGDRYGEDIACDVPRDADYSSQTLIGKDPEYYWWLPCRPQRLTFSAPFQTLRFVKGWASPDPGFIWMVSFESELSIDRINIKEFGKIEFMLYPCLFAGRRSQRLFVLVNDVYLDEFVLTTEASVSCNVASLPPSAGVTIRFVHPDAFAAASIGNHPETRMLSFALSSLSLT